MPTNYDNWLQDQASDHCDNSEEEAAWEEYETFRDERSDKDTLEALNDWLDLKRSTATFPDNRSAFEEWDFGKWNDRRLAR